MKTFTSLICIVILLACGCAFADGNKPYTVTVTTRFDPQARMSDSMKSFFDAHPEVRLELFGGIRVTEAWTSGAAMAMAANIGPDIFEMDIRQAVDQGLAYPLTEWIGSDGILKNGRPKLKSDGSPDINGQIDADEAKWDGWMKIDPIFRQMSTVNGIPYALPWNNGSYVCLLYSKSMAKKAGLDPMRPPQDWNEFKRWCRKLYDRKNKVPTVIVNNQPWAFSPWVYAAGSSIIVQDRVSPTTGKSYTFIETATDFRTPDTGENLQNAMPKWRTSLTSPENVAAVAFYYELRWSPWIMNPADNEPIELTADEVGAGKATRNGKTVTFKPDEVYEGCIGIENDYGSILKRLGRTLSMTPLWGGSNLTSFEMYGVQPTDLGMFAYPGRTKKNKPVMQVSVCLLMLGKDIAHRGGDTEAERKAYRDTVWTIFTLICSQDAADESLRTQVASGQAKFLNPNDLARLGFTDYIKEIPPEIKMQWDRLNAGKTMSVVEPFNGKWLQFRDYLQREILDVVLRPAGKAFDYKAGLARLERDAETGIMFERKPEELDKYRTPARIIAGFIILLLAVFVVLIVKDQMRRRESRAGVYKGMLPWIMLLPALVSIALWGYYPLSRGLMMAFQNYNIGGNTKFVGLNNFISIALDPNFYHYMLTTGRFVLWNFALAFFTPILLALFLSEVPKFKIFFRTLYFLPQMTSAIVVTLLWKEMFSSGSDGLLNSLGSTLFGRAGFKPIDWLGDPAVVMACVIVPGVWASAGIGSLIYLAALKSTPDELYEAASMDGAGIFQRIRRITLPTIMPLILINFIGAFIAVVQSMGSIFLLTFGGPGKETMVMSMAIWQEAYINLRFSMATSYAWILGSILVGFAYLQMRILRRVDFRQAKEV